MLLASRPEFDDLMDGLTFGVVSGVAYACFDTIVRFWDLLIGGPVEADPGLWMSLIFLHGFVKPLVLGTATGIACAEYSGLGRGYDGFTPRYYRGVVEAVLANIGFWGGIYLLSFVSNPTTSVVLSTGWGLLILGILILRVRNVLHTGLLEAALERSARDGGIGSSGELQFCLRCEMPLLDNASFCTACGTAVRAQAKPHKAAVSASVGADQGPGAAAAGDAVPRRDRPGRRGRHPAALATAVTARVGGLDETDGAGLGRGRQGPLLRRRGGSGMSQNPPWPPQGQGTPQDPRGNFPPSRVAATRQQGGYPQQGGGYPQQGGGYPQGGYPAARWPYPPQGGGYPPQQGGYPPQGGYQPQGYAGPFQGQPQGGYPNQGQGGYQPPPPAGGGPAVRAADHRPGRAPA